MCTNQPRLVCLVIWIVLAAVFPHVNKLQVRFLVEECDADIAARDSYGNSVAHL